MPLKPRIQNFFVRQNDILSQTALSPLVYCYVETLFWRKAEVMKAESIYAPFPGNLGITPALRVVPICRSDQDQKILCFD